MAGDEDRVALTDGTKRPSGWSGLTYAENLRLRGLIKKVGRTYKYYLTPTGKQVIATGLYLKSLRVMPMLSAA
ncbi:MAG: hypothetical protein ACR2NN_21675 [Bryobacteraceae bacterium]